MSQSVFSTSQIIEGSIIFTTNNSRQQLQFLTCHNIKYQITPLLKEGKNSNFIVQRKQKDNNFMQQPGSPFQKTKSTNFQSFYGISTLSLPDEPSVINPQNSINSNPQYKRLFNQFLKNNTLMSQIVSSSKRKQQENAIKSYISKSIETKAKYNEFEQKFKDEYNLKKKKPIMKIINSLNTINQKIGQTKEQARKHKKQLFFSQPKKVIQLQEQCMLLEYYYKDRSEFMIPDEISQLSKTQTFLSKSKKRTPNISIDYLRNRDDSENRHKRFEPNQKQKQALFLTHNEGYFEKMSKMGYQRCEKFRAKAFSKAQMNYAFKRQKNFAQMQEIIKQNRYNSLLQSTQNLNPEQTKRSQQKFNKSMRLFLKFAYIEQIKRIYFDYIDLEGIDRLIKFILQGQFDYKIKEDRLRYMTRKIIQYKIQQRLDFYDFVELFQRIQQTFGVDLMTLIQQKHPDFFRKPQQTLIQQNFAQIKKEMTQKKLKFIIKLIFDSSSHLVLEKYLPVKSVPRLLSNVGISGNDVPRNKLFEFSYWNLKRPDGLGFKEFYFTMLMLGVKDNHWQHIAKLLEKIKVKELLH